MPAVTELYRFPDSPSGIVRSLDLIHQGPASRFRLTEVKPVDRKGKKFGVVNSIEMSFEEMGQLCGFIETYVTSVETNLG